MDTHASDPIERTFTAPEPDQLLAAGFERLEAFLNLAVVEEHRSAPAAADV